jgi:diadenylate cyclase
VVGRRSALLQRALSQVAPGSALREGLDRIVKAKTGALLVVGDGPEVLSICTGGFLLDATFTPQRLSELAKMDGAIILARDASRIARANVHLVPDVSVPTSETGTRHRTAERVARSLDVPVISVSEEMGVITIYAQGDKHVLEDIPRLLNRANQALQTLERYKSRLDDVTNTLATLEAEDLVTIRDVTAVLQRTEMVRRIADEIAGYVVELGVDARLIELQLDELMADVDDDRQAMLQDYLGEDSGRTPAEALLELSSLTTDDLLDPRTVVRVLGLPEGSELDRSLTPRGYRQLAGVPRLPADVVSSIVDRFPSLHRIMRATVHELAEVPGVGEAHAVAVKEGLARLTESNILDRFS